MARHACVKGSDLVSHGRKAVDPLKRRAERGRRERPRSLPRSKGRGPIEAPRRCRPEGGGGGCLPRSKGRGPIEACRSVRACSRKPCLPRSKGRGPIEARHLVTEGAGDEKSPTVERPWTH